MMFGFWVFLMSDAILFGMVFATYVTMIHATAGGPGPYQLYDIKSIFVETLRSWPAASLSAWPRWRSNTSTASHGLMGWLA